MAFKMTTPQANPTTLTSGTSVTFSFQAKSLDGGGTLKTTYSSSDVELDGQTSITKNHAIGTDNSTVTDTFSITGSSGQRDVKVAASDGSDDREFDVVLDIEGS